MSQRELGAVVSRLRRAECRQTSPRGKEQQYRQQERKSSQLCSPSLTGNARGHQQNSRRFGPANQVYVMGDDMRRVLGDLCCQATTLVWRPISVDSERGTCLRIVRILSQDSFQADEQGVCPRVCFLSFQLLRSHVLQRAQDRSLRGDGERLPHRSG
jgi:hypothetical protein